MRRLDSAGGIERVELVDAAAAYELDLETVFSVVRSDFISVY